MANLTEHQQRFLDALLSFVDFKTGETFVGARKVAERSGLSLSKAQDCFKELEQLGVLARAGTRSGTHGPMNVWRVSDTYRTRTGGTASNVPPNVPQTPTNVPQVRTAEVREVRDDVPQNVPRNVPLSIDRSVLDLSDLIEERTGLIDQRVSYLIGKIERIEQKLDRLIFDLIKPVDQTKPADLSDPSDPYPPENAAPAAGAEKVFAVEEDLEV